MGGNHLKSYKEMLGKKEKFSIRKTTLGVFSVMIGANLLLLPGVAADEVPSEQVTPTTSASETTEMELRESVARPESGESLNDQLNQGRPNFEPVSPEDQEKDRTNTPRIPEDNREHPESNEYTNVGVSDPRNVEVKGATKRLVLNDIPNSGLSSAYYNAIEKAKKAGFEIEYTDRVVGRSDDISGESSYEANIIENFIENNRERLQNYKKNRISNRLQYERESKEHEYATEDFQSYQFEGNDLRQAVNNQTVIRGYEYGAKTIVTASEYYPAEAVKYINSLDELSFKNMQTTTNAPEEHSNGQVAVLKQGQPVTVSERGLEGTYLTVDGERKQVTRMDHEYTLVSSPYEEQKALLWIRNVGGKLSVTAGADRATDKPLTINVKIRYYDENGHEIVNNTGSNLYAISDLTHGTSRKVLDSYTPTGLVARIQYNDQIEDQYMNYSQAYTSQWSVYRRDENQKVTFHRVQGWTETHTPILGDEITEEVIPETDAQGVVKGHYHISRDKGYEHVVYVPIFNYEQIDEKKSVTIGAEDEIVPIPGSSITRQGNELYSVGDNMHVENGSHFHYAGDSLDKYGWQNSRRTKYYGTVAVASKTNQFTFSTTFGKTGEYVSMDLNYDTLDVPTPEGDETDPDELINVPKVQTTRWIAEVPNKVLKKTEYHQHITYADDTGREIAPSNVQVYTKLNVEDLEHHSSSDYYFDGLLTKAEQEELYRNFHENGDLFITRNGERVNAKESNDVYEYYNYRPNSEGVLERVGEKRQIIGLVTKEVPHPRVSGWKPTRWKAAYPFYGVTNAYWRESANLMEDYKKKIPAQWTGKNVEVAGGEGVEMGDGSQTVLYHVIYTQSTERESTRFVTVQDGSEVEISPTLEGVHEAPAFLQGEKYHYNGITTTVAGVTTHYYDLVTGDKPPVEPNQKEEKAVTRFVTLQNEQEVEVAETVEGTQPAPTFLQGEKYHFNKQTKTENGITTHYYDLVTGDKPAVEPNEKEEKAVTRFVTLQGTQEVEVAPTVEGTQAAPTFLQGEKYYFNKQTKTEDGITTHYYDLVTGDKPAVEPNEKEEKAVTRFVTLENEQEVEVSPTVEGTQPAPTFLQGEKYHFNKQTKTENGITTHYYDLVTGDKPAVEPNEKEEKAVTRFVTLQGTQEVEVAPTVEGTQAAPTFLQGEKYYFNKQTKTEDGITTHYYDLVTGDKPAVEPNQKEEKAVTRFVTLQDSQEVEVAPTVEGTQPAPTFLQGEKYHFNKQTKTEDGITTHYYDLVTGEKPTGDPNESSPKIVTRFVTIENEQEVEVAPTVEGTQAAPTFLQGEKYYFSKKTKTEDGITTHYYDLVLGAKPLEDPNRKEELKITRFVTVENNQEVEIAETVVGTKPAPTFLQGEKYYFTKQTKVEDGITTHYYELVVGEKPKDAPSVELPEGVIGEVPNDAPSYDLPELTLPQDPDKVEEVPKTELPRTSAQDLQIFNLFGWAIGLSAFGLVFKRSKKANH